MIGVGRRISRRTALGSLGTGLAAFTGVSTRQSNCSAAAVAGDCEASFALDGPHSVAPTDGGPRFTLSNNRNASVVFATDAWSLYRAGEEWTHLDSGDAGRPVSIDGDSTVSYLLLVETDRSGPSSTTTETTTTRYIGPVSLRTGTYAFVIAGRHEGSRTSLGTRFEVID